MSITVKIARVPGPVSEVMLNDGATVADALASASMQRGNNEILRVNGAEASDSTVLSDGDRVVLVVGAKGNAAKPKAKVKKTVIVKKKKKTIKK